MTTPPASQIRIVLADDHAVLRAGLRLLLDAQSDLHVVGEAGHGLAAIEMAQALQPDVIILDLTMPGLGGLEALPLLRRKASQARILVLTMHDDESYLRLALRGGASGYVLKKAVDNELLSAVRAVMRGELYVHPAMTRSLLDDMLPPSPAKGQGDSWETLSEREREVLVLVAHGHTAAEIGRRLALSAKTIETYRARGMEKLALRSRAQLVQYALAHGLM